MFGARILYKLTRKLEEQIEGAKIGEDIEYVHQLRVASRRLRAAMPVFRRCFDKDEFKGWLKEVKSVTRSMGEARDLDVQITFLEDHLEDLGKDPGSIGVEYLLASHRERRASIQPGLVASLDTLRKSTFLRDMKRACREIVRGNKKGKIRSPDLFSGAHFHVASRLDDLVEMEDCVHDEKAIDRHHEMRIRAKWLRYTMEIFSDVYREKLDREISFMKRLQDALGDMHDYDVWIEYLPRFINEVRGSQDQGRNAIRDIEQGLRVFQKHVGQLRSSRYSEFGVLWNEAREQRFFEKLRVKVQEGIFGEDRVLGGDGKSKVGIMADIHGNLTALEAVLEDARARGLGTFLNAGDTLGYGIDPNQVIELLCNSGVLSIKGNYDLKVLEGKGVRKDPALRMISRNLSQTGRSYLEILPERAVVNVGGKKLLMVHGSPRSVKESIFPDKPDSDLSQLLGNVNEDMVVTAHTHIPFVKNVDGIAWLNPGSVGRSYDGDPRASYAILTPEKTSIEIVRIEYDIEGMADKLRKAGLPEKYPQALLRGIPLEAVEFEDMKLGGRSLRGRMLDVRRVAEGYGETDGHSEQVRKLALKLFDQLGEVHNLGRGERNLLEAAALLHDIGWSEGMNTHNKASLRLIINDRALPLSTTERLIVGSIARYHRKGPPKRGHSNFGRLSKEHRELVTKLSGLLRVADGMDYGHSSVVRNVTAFYDDRRVVLSLKARGDPSLEDKQVAKKKDLFERVFHRNLRLQWSP